MTHCTNFGLLVLTTLALGCAGRIENSNGDPFAGGKSSTNSTTGIGGSLGLGGAQTWSGGRTTGGVTAIGGTSTGGKSAATGGVPSGTICANPVLIERATPGIANFDNYDGVMMLSTWSFALGGDVSTGAYAGPYAYGDRTVGTKTDAIEIFDMVAGYSSTYALRIADSMAQKMGGGLGLWLSACLNARIFTGMTFFVRGNAPTGQATLTLSMGDTMPSTPIVTGGMRGTCPGTDATCIHPTFTFAVTDSWTQIQAPWTAFKAGQAVGNAVAPDGRNIIQLQIAVGLSWVPDATGSYTAVLAPYELVVDNWAFY